MNKLLTLLKILFKFKNPLKVINFYLKKYLKGKKIKIKPWNGNPFIVARGADWFIIKRILNGQKVETTLDKTNGQQYIVINDIYLRAGTSDTYVYKEIFIDECYKEGIVGLSKESTVIDIGAHIGLFSLYCSDKCKKVLAYEAHPVNYKLAKKNTLNKNIEIFNLAVWLISNKEISISEDTKGGGTGDYSVSDKRDGGIYVKTIALEDILINIKHCDLLKLDIEGAEYEVILPAPDKIFDKISKIILEYHPSLNEKHSFDNLIDKFKKNKYRVEVKAFKNSPNGMITAYKN